MKQLFLVRHGQTEWNHQQRFQGHTDVPLDTIGLRQAERIASRLSSRPITRVYSSDLARAFSTAEAIARAVGCEVNATPLLRESSFGEWEGLTRAQIEARFPDEFKLYLHDSLTHRPPGGESLSEVQARVLQALSQVQEDAPEGAVIVGHGGCLRWLVLEALNAPIQTYRRLRLDNASLSLIEYANGHSWLSLFNDVSHLEDLLSDVTTSVQLNQ